VQARIARDIRKGSATLRGRNDRRFTAILQACQAMPGMRQYVWL